MFVGKDHRYTNPRYLQVSISMQLELINNPNVVGGVKNELPILTGPDPFSSRCLSLLIDKCHGRKSSMAAQNYDCDFFRKWYDSNALMFN